MEDPCVKEQIAQIHQKLKEATAIYRRAVSDTGASENEFWIWYTLIAIEGEHSQQSICESWSLSKQTVNSIIANLVRRGYVTLAAIPGTRNRKQIQLTPQGRSYGEDLVRPVIQAEERALRRLPQEERQACTRALSQYILILKEELYGTEE